MAILNNQIIFPATQSEPVSGDTYSGGVVLWSYNGEMTPFSDLTISGNTIRNALGPAIWTNIPLTGGTAITSNLMTNPARSSASAERTGIYISGRTSKMQIEKNTVIDTAKTPMIHVGISAVSTCESNCMLTHNAVSPVTVSGSVLGPGWVR